MDKKFVILAAVLQYLAAVALLVIAVLYYRSGKQFAVYAIVGVLCVIMPTVSLIRYFVSKHKKDGDDKKDE